MRHAGTQDIETPRLLLRRLLPEDAPQMYANWASDPEVTRWLRWEPHKKPRRDPGTAGRVGTALPQPGLLPVGHGGKGHRTGVRLHQPVHNSLPGEPQQKTEWPGLDLTDGVWEPGYCIGRKWWNKGFTTEALRAVVAYWFTHTDSSWLACGHAAANPASGRVMEKAGFVYHHNTVYHKFDGTPVECRSYLLTRKAFETA